MALEREGMLAMERTWYRSSRPAPGRLSDEERRRIEPVLKRYCEARVPPRFRDEIQVDYRIRGTTVTLFERRSAWRAPGEWTESSVAQFRYDPVTATWSLLCCDRHQRWHPYDRRPTKNLASLLREVDADRSGIFWG
jgi:hypothetical protein